MSVVHDFANVAKAAAPAANDVAYGVLELPKPKPWVLLRDPGYLKKRGYQTINYTGLLGLTAEQARSFFTLARWGDAQLSGSWPCAHCGAVAQHYVCKARTRVPPEGKNSPTQADFEPTQEWKCRSCKRRFGLFTGTILEGNRIPSNRLLRGVAAFVEAHEGVAALRTAPYMNLSHPTVIELFDKLRRVIAYTLMREPMAPGYKFVDAQFFRHYMRVPNKGSGASAAIKAASRTAEGKHPKEYHAVLWLTGFDPAGHPQTRCMQVWSETEDAAVAFVHAFLDPETSILVTDAASQYGLAGAEFIAHETVNHSRAFQDAVTKINNNVSENRASKGRVMTSHTYRRMTVKTVGAVCWEVCWRSEMLRQNNLTRLFDLLARIMNTPPDAKLPPVWVGAETEKATGNAEAGKGSKGAAADQDSTLGDESLIPCDKIDVKRKRVGRPSSDPKKAVNRFKQMTREGWDGKADAAGVNGSAGKKAESKKR